MQQPLENRIQNELDYKYDLYRNVDKIKYTDKYTSNMEIFKIHRKLEKEREDERRQLFKERNLSYPLAEGLYL